MSILVEQQDEQIKNIESTAMTVEKDTEAGWVLRVSFRDWLFTSFNYSLGYTDKAVDSARAARKKRWICFFITLIILAIVAIVVGVTVSQHINNNKSSWFGPASKGLWSQRLNTQPPLWWISSCVYSSRQWTASILFSPHYFPRP